MGDYVTKKKKKQRQSRQICRDKKRTTTHNIPKYQRNSNNKKNIYKLPNIDEFLNDDDIKKAQKEAYEYINRTKNEDGSHSGIVCVCCEWFIIGVEPVNWISETNLLENKHRLSTDIWEQIYECKIPTKLKEQYEVKSTNNMLHDLLLSPFAKKKNDSYTCCQKCYDSLKLSKSKAPPKYAISNGFALGTIPDDVVPEITEILSTLIAPIRPFMYVVAFQGGANKQLRGTCSFYSDSSSLKKVRTGVSFTSSNPGHSQGAINTFYEQNLNPNIYVSICGRFTPEQKIIARNRVKYDIRDHTNLYKWFKQNNCTYSKEPDIQNIQEPIIIEDEPNNNNTDDSADASKETECDFNFYFPTNGEPDAVQGTYKNSEKFASAMLNGDKPTLLFHQSPDYIDDRDLQIAKVFPVQFPFGFGGVYDNRISRVSPQEVLRSYSRIARKDLRRQDFVLVVNSMKNRIMSFNSGYIQCRTNLKGKTLAERVSTCTIEDIKQAARRKEAKFPTNYRNAADCLIQSIETSCAPVAHSDKAADNARGNFFSLWQYFGPPSLFFTFTPCDRCSFRVQIYINPKKHYLMDYDIPEEDCIADYHLRSTNRRRYPGGSALEFYSLTQIIIECLFQWNIKDCVSKGKGILGKLGAFAAAIEEQGRGTLHAHILAWIAWLQELMENLYDHEGKIDQTEKEKLMAYIKQIMCASYEIFDSDEEVTHNSYNDESHEEHSNLHDVKLCHEVLSEADPQVLRNARNKSSELQNEGKIITCQKCNEQTTTQAFIKN